MKKTTSIVMPEAKPCAFCAYLKNEKPFTFVFRDQNIAILVTREQRGRPHILVIPTSHVETLLDVSDELISNLALAVKKISIAIEKEFVPLGISVWQNNGVTSNQTIRHVHFHIAGTIDDSGTEWGEVPELPISETEKIAVKLRPYFN